MSESLEKHQVKFRRVDWRRITESAERDGVSPSALLLECFNRREQNGREPLPVVARAKPLSTGELIVAHMVIYRGSEDDARVAMHASVAEWNEAIGIIPGLREEIDRRWGGKRG